jgi:hypothetical protein
MTKKIKPLCDCGQPIDTDEPEHVEETDLLGKSIVHQCRPTKCKDCRNKSFWGRWDASVRREEV